MAIRETLAQWIDRGVVIMPNSPRKDAPIRYKAAGKTVAQMVIADRR
jgi:hypothetical protein